MSHTVGRQTQKKYQAVWDKIRAGTPLAQMMAEGVAHRQTARVWPDIMTGDDFRAWSAAMERAGRDVAWQALFLGRRVQVVIDWRLDRAPVPPTIGPLCRALAATLERNIKHH